MSFTFVDRDICPPSFPLGKEKRLGSSKGPHSNAVGKSASVCHKLGRLRSISRLGGS